MLQNPTVVKPRYALFDGLRGATMLSMVLYHFSYDLFVIAKNHSQWPTLPCICGSSRFAAPLFCWQAFAGIGAAPAACAAACL